MTETIRSEYLRWKEKAVADPALIAELNAIENAEDEIFDRFYTALSFGTAGLRGVIGAGTNRMNVYTVGRATQGLADYIHSKNGRGKVAISYDSRINSPLFASYCARVLAANGITAYLTPTLEPTPVLSFMVRYYGCDAGIMITASHNPAKYNGYKCYGPDGCQMTDNDADITTSFIEKADLFDGVKVVSFNEGEKAGLIVTTGDDMLESYYKEVMARSIDPAVFARSDFRVLYTPLNGTGNIPVRTVLSRLGVKVDVVPEQEAPDGNFPTTPFPNPEFAQAFECGENMTSSLPVAERPDLILATDPDADRVGIAVKDKDGAYQLMTGNEVGCMLLNYIGSRKKALGTLPENAMFVKSIVSSDLAEKVAAKYGIRCVNVLTGFKYIGEQIKLLEEKGREAEFQFAFEESYGYLAGTYVRDKDAVIASMLICEMAAYCREQGLTLLDYMQGIYREFGVFRHKTISSYFDGSEGMAKMKAITSSLREKAPQKIARYKVLRVNDHLERVSTDCVNGTEAAIDLPRSDVLCYFLEHDHSLIIRPSGTEPKIKAYMTSCAPTLAEADAIVASLEAEARRIFGETV